MPDNFDQTPGTICWNELEVKNVNEAKRFYAEVLGWTSQDMQGGYTVFMNNGKPVAGMMNIDNIDGGEQIPPNWFVYIAVADINEALEKTKANGGIVSKGPFEVPNMGTMAVIIDAAGAALAIVEPPQKGD